MLAGVLGRHRNKCLPYHADLYSSFWRVSYQPWASIDRFWPFFCDVFLSGCAMVPLGERVRLAVAVSSM